MEKNWISIQKEIYPLPPILYKSKQINIYIYNSEAITGLNMRSQTIKLLEENIEIYCIQ